MGKISEQMRPDVAKMRKMRDVSSVFGPLRGEEYHPPANNLSGRGDGEG